MPIDLSTVDWLYVGVLSIIVFLAVLIGNLLAFGHRGFGALLTTILFAVMFVAFTYYPHELPLPTSISKPGTAPPPPSAASPSTASPPPQPTPQRPNNPVRDITPPAPAR